MIAATLQLDFVDLDQAVLHTLGATSVTHIFDKLGENAWRQAERVELDRLLGEKGRRVIALGGGTPMAPGVADVLQAAKVRGEIYVVLLDPGERELALRLKSNRGDRPLLNTAAASGDAQANATAEVRALYESRMPLYRKLANVRVDTTQSEAACCQQVITAFTDAHAR